MNKLLSFFFVSLSLLSASAAALAEADTTSVSEVDSAGTFNPRKSHWLVNFNFESTKYETDYAFIGERKTFNKDEQQSLFGGRLGFGGELYLGAGLMTSTRVEGYYSGKLFKRDLSADPDAPSVVFSEDKITSQFYGVDAVQSLSMIFDMKTKMLIFDQWAYLTVEPFVEAGIGAARAYNRRNYRYDTGPSGVQESYRKTITDELTNVRFGAGINFTSRQGYFFTMRVTQNHYDLSKRKVTGVASYDNGTVTNLADQPKTNKIDPIVIYAIGGGYKF